MIQEVQSKLKDNRSYLRVNDDKPTGGFNKKLDRTA